jgi:predicted metalloendopeptidase
MFPQEVNAYYSPSTNEIVFPAGILQAPFFSETYEPALNFGGIGSVIGHEMTHGFDDQGSKFDAEGNLKNWWTENDFNNYRLKTNVIKQQYSEYTINNMKVNGELTLGENIADIGGVTIALGAFKKYLEENGNYDNYELLLQRFFINYSKIWRSNSRDEDMKIRILTDPHSPPIFRVNGVLKNINDFYKIFNLSTNSELYLPEELRAKIW